MSALVSLLRSPSLLPFGPIALSCVSILAMPSQSLAEDPEGGAELEGPIVVEDAVQSASFHLALEGGVHGAIGDTERAEPPLGYVAITGTYEFFLDSDARFAFGGNLQLGGITADPGQGLAFLFGGVRFAIYHWLSETSSLSWWLSVGVGAAGYDVTTFGSSVQLGMDYMFSSFMGIGIFGDVTTVAPAARESFGILDVEDFEGVVAFHGGGRLVFRFGG
ncbi:MAG: hypothetical protein AAGF12_39930 [Myxococcota bacterium]